MAANLARYRSFTLFTLFGATAFVVDTSTFLFASRHLYIGEVFAKSASFAAAVVYTYCMNVTFTFNDIRSKPYTSYLLSKLSLSIFCRYALGQSLGAVINVVAYVLLRKTSANPISCLFMSAFAGMAANYVLAKTTLKSDAAIDVGMNRIFRALFRGYR
jgi:putative flippase GtrA